MHVVELLFFLLVSSLVLITISKYLLLPTLFGYLLLGIIAGPHGMQLIEHEENISQIAELGIMAIMFTLGLKFSVRKLMSSKQHVLGLGGLQVLSCMAVATVLTALLLGAPWNTALMFGSFIALSSTAIISKLLIERSEITTPHGTRTIAVLLFQDLAVIPMLIYFSYDGSQSGGQVFSVLGGAAVIIMVLVFVGPRVMPGIVNFFARQKSDEIFTVFALCLVIGISLLTHAAGLSMVLGAFFTGMLLAESRHRYLIEDIIRPFREIFLGFFFVSIGLLLDPSVFQKRWLEIIAVCVLLLTLKPLIIYFICRRLDTHRWTSIQVGLALGGTGEFSFVLLAAVAAVGTVEDSFLQLGLAVNLVCMLMPPIMLGVARKMRSRVSGDDWLMQARDLTRIAAAAGSLEDHVVLCGYGQNGKVIGRLLDKHKIPWIAIENNYEKFLAANKHIKNIVYGDARQSESLMALGVQKARSLIISHGVQGAAVQTVHAAKKLAPQLDVVVKVLGHSEIKEAREAGATHLSIAAVETGSSMAVQAMQSYGVSDHAITRDILNLHEEAISGAKPEDKPAAAASASDDASMLHIFEIEVSEKSPAKGQSLAWLRQLSSDAKVELLSVKRDGELLNPENPDEELSSGDRLVLRGSNNELETAKALLLQTETPT